MHPLQTVHCFRQSNCEEYRKYTDGQIEKEHEKALLLLIGPEVGVNPWYAAHCVPSDKVSGLPPVFRKTYKQTL